MRAQLEKKLAQNEKEKKEEHLRQLAQMARDERAGIRARGDPRDEEMREREEFRRDRNKERQRERNLARAAPDRRYWGLMLWNFLVCSTDVYHSNQKCT